MTARAYVLRGMWVADCTRPDCNNTEMLGLFSPLPLYCSYCKHIDTVDWPNDGQVIQDVLDRRPIPHTRNWYPKDHDLAVRAGIPHGQTVDDLLAENAEHGVP